MKKKFIKLKEEHLSHFKHLDLYDALDLLSWPDCFAIGATIDEDDSGTDMPAGLVVVRLFEDQLCIQWLYVIADYRGYGIGKELLTLLARESKARGFESLSARLTSLYEQSGLPWNPKTFFKGLCFNAEEEALPEWEFSTGLLYGKNDVFLHTKKKCNIIPLSDVSDSAKDKVYKTLSARDNLPYDISVLRKKADPELSYVLFDDKRLIGVVLVNRCDNNIYPYYFEAEDKSAADFVADAFEMSEDCVAVGNRVHIIPERTGTINILKQLEFSIPGWKVVNLVADVASLPLSS